MNTPTLLTGLGCGVASGLLLRMAKQELAINKMAGKLSLTSIGNIQPGLCLIAGEVVCEKPLVTPYSQTPAAWYHFAATERGLKDIDNHRKKTDKMLSSGSQSYPFLLRDDSGIIEVIPDGGTAVSHPHHRIMKSQSGKRTALGDRIRKLKEVDKQNHPDGEKKPFFRKIEMEDAPLNVPDDLIEVEPGSREAKSALRKYSESWVQAGDRVYVMGKVETSGSGSPMKITHAGKNAPLMLSTNANDFAPSAFGRNFMVASLMGLGLGALGAVFILMGFGVIRY